MSAANNYSVDMIRKASFVDELNNVLRVQSDKEHVEEKSVVIGYLEKRIKEIDARYKKN